MQVRHVLETCLYVDQLDEAERFYREVLGLEPVSRHAGRHVFLRCGDQMVLLFQPDVSSDPGSEVPPHGSQGPGHVAFGVAEQDLERWKSHLASHGVATEKIVKWPQGGCSIYFRDPAGNSLELATPRIWGLGGVEPSAM